ncbi:response regulator [Planktothrix sp. FACHB-1355]|uniref:Response regulator n=1 Tax=Aerosakkonema funiforme FACHB-1375 TaxID=2949571 RepID=A0A926ZKR6_9CYAN|nr:response regulator [Aerosakkonema funiforme]MBD2185994.1 response regulator [Aerosakkonema funiforme FACHB-1375]MBD3559266.1 response regulator [Planktothrix sp. FACHB-1355]
MNHKKILLVEDNPDDEELTLLAFEESNLLGEVMVVRDGAEALDYLLGMGAYANRDVSFKPAVVLLDLKLPKMDGLEVLRRLRTDERTKFIPVVILTTSIEQEDIIKSYDLGCNSYIRKPVDYLQFIEAVRHMGLYWLFLNKALST